MGKVSFTQGEILGNNFMYPFGGFCDLYEAKGRIIDPPFPSKVSLGKKKQSLQYLQNFEDPRKSMVTP